MGEMCVPTLHRRRTGRRREGPLDLYDRPLPHAAPYVNGASIRFDNLLTLIEPDPESARPTGLRRLKQPLHLRLRNTGTVITNRDHKHPFRRRRTYPNFARAPTAWLALMMRLENTW